ncbi:MAG: hypothetical protein LBR23_04215 [Spirochaetaceae bacterium]|jgi:hypothetical protein|nr:hypothetical protein [Spirochaetaceae bacterium]
MDLTREEKLELLRGVNWDTPDTPEAMLDVVEGRAPRSLGFERWRLFQRTLERLNWYDFFQLWGPEQIKELYTPELLRTVRRELRGRFDYAVSVLRGEPVPLAGWGSERCQSLQRTFLSNRRYGA